MNTLEEARAARMALDAALSFPAFSGGANGGMTTTTTSIVEAIDWPTVGATSYVLPITEDYVAAATAIGLSLRQVDMTTVINSAVISIEAAQLLGVSLTLEQARAAKLAAISARTKELRATGFVYTDGHRYSLEHDALRQVMEAKSWLDDDQRNGRTGTARLMRYPLVWPSVDRGAFCYMPDEAAVAAFALAASLADRALTEGGAGLEMTLAMAESLEAVEAVRDGR